ncbi:MAG: translation initiation factor IF-3 [Candidatus Pacebacteria bacterium]|nr:translation initiation factor IF-3 [Candidatus Paceibacterota bacterium]
MVSRTNIITAISLLHNPELNDIILPHKTVKRKPYKRRRRNKKWITANHRIKFPKVRVLNETGGSLGIMSTKKALTQAREQQKDLVLITDKAKPPVTKIIEISKFKYQQQQRRAKNRKSARTQDTKEVRLTMFMGESDFAARLRRVKRFLKKGDKVRLTLHFKGRQITKKDFGYELFGKVIAATKDLAKVEIEPKIMGRKLLAQLTPATD